MTFAVDPSPTDVLAVDGGDTLGDLARLPYDVSCQLIGSTSFQVEGQLSAALRHRAGTQVFSLSSAVAFGFAGRALAGAAMPKQQKSRVRGDERIT